jgi:hypothetical protein
MAAKNKRAANGDADQMEEVNYVNHVYVYNFFQDEEDNKDVDFENDFDEDNEDDKDAVMEVIAIFCTSK